MLPRSEVLTAQRQAKCNQLEADKEFIQKVYNVTVKNINEAINSITLQQNELIQGNNTYIPKRDDFIHITNLTSVINTETKRKIYAIERHNMLCKKIEVLKKQLPEGKLAVKNAKIAAKELVNQSIINRRLVAIDADKRISTARLLKLPEDILFVIRSFFTYETRIELLESKYPMKPLLNKLSAFNTYSFSYYLHKRPNYLAGLTAEEAEVFVQRQWRTIPYKHQARKAHIQMLLQKYKEIDPNEAMHILKSLIIIRPIAHSSGTQLWLDNQYSQYLLGLVE